MISKVLASVMLAAAIAVTPLTSFAANVLHLRQVPVMDRSGFGQPVAAATLLVPADWRFEGGVRWAYSSCLTDLVSQHAVASSPDGSAGFEMFPAIAFGWADDPNTRAIMQTSSHMTTGCRVAPPLDARGVVLKYIIPRFRPGAVVVRIEPAPMAARALYEKVMTINASIMQMASGQLRTDAVKALIAYQVKGRPYEERITASIWQYAQMNPYTGAQYSYMTDTLFGFRAPRGQLGRYEALLGTMLASYRPNPQWVSAITTVWAKIQTGWSRTSGNMARIWHDAAMQIDRTIMSTWQYRQETVDRVSLAHSRALRGVDTYVNPYTQQPTELPTGWRGAWASNRGQYILTDDPSVDPNRSFPDVTWKKMQPMR